MKKRLFVCLLLVALLLPLLAGTVSADCGPKPSVKIAFKGLEDETYYVTLLSKAPSTGPWSWEPDITYDSLNQENWFTDKSAWEAFHSYADADGYYFLEYFENCSDSDLFQWNYYPPETFKILLFFPEYDRLAVSPKAYSRYAFDSYYTVNAGNLALQDVAETENMTVSKSYDYDWEIFSLVCRIVLTIAIELLLALAFGFRQRKAIRVIYITNIVTQIILNVALNIINCYQGPWAYLFHYVWMEFAVFAAEAIVYRKALPHSGEERQLHPILYAFTANLVSFGLGLLLSFMIPGIF